MITIELPEWFTWVLAIWIPLHVIASIIDMVVNHRFKAAQRRFRQAVGIPWRRRH